MRTFVELPECLQSNDVFVERSATNTVTVFCGINADAETLFDFLMKEHEQHPIVAECERLRTSLESVRSDLAKIVSTRFGWDGDCGVLPLADRALETIERALEPEASSDEII